MVKLLVIEGQPALRQGLEYLLATEEDLQLLGIAPDCAAALPVLDALRPDVVLVDIDCPPFEQQTTVATLRLIGISTALILLTFSDTAWSRQLTRQAGASAVVLKSMPAGTLLTAIREVALRT